MTCYLDILRSDLRRHLTPRKEPVMTQAKSTPTPPNHGWMQRFEAHVVSLRPELAGKIDWPTAQCLYDQRYRPDHAAQKVCLLASLVRAQGGAA